MKPRPDDERHPEMRSVVTVPLLLVVALAATACLSWPQGGPAPTSPEAPPMARPTPPAPDDAPVMLSEAQWRERLTPMQYYVLREKGTERPFTGEYTDTETLGTYCCAGCGAELFVSDAKFHSGCGWPSFFQPLSDARLLQVEDRSHGMVRTEVMCRRCGGHLGHVFDDGPPPTYLRFCINSASLVLRPKAR